MHACTSTTPSTSNFSFCIGMCGFRKEKKRSTLMYQKNLVGAGCARAHAHLFHARMCPKLHLYAYYCVVKIPRYVFFNFISRIQAHRHKNSSHNFHLALICKRTRSTDRISTQINCIVENDCSNLRSTSGSVFDGCNYFYPWTCICDERVSKVDNENMQSRNISQKSRFFLTRRNNEEYVYCVDSK